MSVITGLTLGLLLQAFVSDYARQIYGITPPDKTVRLVKEPCTVPAQYGDVVPIRAGGRLLSVWLIVLRELVPGLIEEESNRYGDES